MWIPTKLSSYIVLIQLFNSEPVFKAVFLFLNLGQVQDNGKIKKTLQYKGNFCSFLQITEASYLSANSNIIEKNMRNIYKLIYMSFLYISFGVFPSIALHTILPHHILQRFVSDLFKLVFLLPFSILRFIISRYQTFINAYHKLYFALVHNIYVAHHENDELVPVLSSVFCYPLRLLKNKAQSGASVG